MGFFEKFEMAPPDSILGLTSAFLADPRPFKTNLGVGTYKTKELKTYLPMSVSQAEKELAAEGLNREYLPIEGEASFLREVKKLILGSELAEKRETALVQSVGGTGALSVGARFLKKLGHKKIFISDPTWDNHYRVFEHAGFKVVKYPYYDKMRAAFDFPTTMETIKKAPKGSAFILQPATHNPTGCDPSPEEWKEILTLMKKRRILPFFDFCYQGFGEGLEEDAKAIRLFLEEGMEMLIAVSFSKNFGLYAERVGALFVLPARPEQVAPVQSNLKVIIRGIYSNPPCHGSRIITKILTQSSLREMWEGELIAMRGRILEMRRALVVALAKHNLDRFAFIERQRGLFSFTGLKGEEVKRLTSEFGIYMTQNGRINMAGLNSENVVYVADCIAKVLSSHA